MSLKLTVFFQVIFLLGVFSAAAILGKEALMYVLLAMGCGLSFVVIVAISWFIIELIKED